MFTKYDDVIEFPVTQQHIDEGGLGARNCPVSLAIKEATGQFNLVGWTNVSIYWGDTKQVTKNYVKPRPIEYSTSAETRAAIEAYDKNNPMKPFTGKIIRER